MIIRRSPARLGFVLPWLLACGNAAGPDPTYSTIAFTFYPRESAIQLDQIVFEFDDGSGVRSVSGSEFTSDRSAQPYSQSFRIQDDHVIDVRAIITDGNDTLAVGRIELMPRTNWTRGVSAHILADNPYPCLGCRGARGFPLRSPSGASTDSLFLVWSGHDRSSTIVY